MGEIVHWSSQFQATVFHSREATVTGAGEKLSGYIHNHMLTSLHFLHPHRTENLLHREWCHPRWRVDFSLMSGESLIDMPRSQHDVNNPSLRLPFQVILDCWWWKSTTPLLHSCLLCSWNFTWHDPDSGKGQQQQRYIILITCTLVCGEMTLYACDLPPQPNLTGIKIYSDKFSCFASIR